MPEIDKMDITLMINQTRKLVRIIIPSLSVILTALLNVFPILVCMTTQNNPTYNIQRRVNISEL